MSIRIKRLNFDKLTSNRNCIGWMFLFAFMCTQFALNGHTIFSHIAYSLFVGYVACDYIFKKKTKIYYTNFFTVYVLFMVYAFSLMALGFASSRSIVVERLIYMSVNLVFYIALYNFVIVCNNREILLNITVWAAVLSLIFIMVNLEEIWTGRLGHTMTSDEPSFYVYGIPLYLSGNSISTFTNIGAFFSLYLVGLKKKKIYFLTFLFLSFGTLLSGSRKGLLLLFLFTIFGIYMFFEGNKYAKLAKIIIGIAILYFIVMKVPVFYNIIGKRTDLLISNLLGLDVQEASMDNRMYLARLAKKYIYEHPVFGWGLGNFSYLAKSKYSVDNNYLDIWVSCGVFGLIVYYYYVIIAIKEYKRLKIKKTISIFTKIMFFMLICFLVLDLGSVVYHIRNQLMWVVVFFAYITMDNLKYKKDKECT